MKKLQKIIAKAAKQKSEIHLNHNDWKTLVKLSFRLEAAR